MASSHCILCLCRLCVRPGLMRTSSLSLQVAITRKNTKITRFPSISGKILCMHKQLKPGVLSTVRTRLCEHMHNIANVCATYNIKSTNMLMPVVIAGGPIHAYWMQLLLLQLLRWLKCMQVTVAIKSYGHHQCHCNCYAIWSDNTELQLCMGVTNNFTCYCKLYRLVPVIFTPVQQFYPTFFVLFTPTCSTLLYFGMQEGSGFKMATSINALRVKRLKLRQHTEACLHISNLLTACSQSVLCS